MQPVRTALDFASFTLAVPLLALALPCIAPSRAADRNASGAEAPLDELIRSELDFAAASRARGMRDSFLEFLARESVLFRPGPVEGRAWMANRPAPKGVLSWYPAVARISGAGDLGFTSGPFEFRPTGPEDPQVYHGTFFSIWQRQDSGLLKVVLDGGTTHGKQEPAPTPLRPGEAAAGGSEPSRNRAAKTLSRRNWRKELASLADLDRILCGGKDSAGSGGEGLPRDDVMVLVDAREPAVGADALTQLKSTLAAHAECRTIGRGLSKSGDLAYTYGAMAAPSGHSQNATGGGTILAHYVAVWRREPGGSLRLAVLLQIPMPESTPSN